MKPIKPYRFLLLLLVFAALVAVCGCGGKTMNKRVTLWRSDKIPYGTYYAYENLRHLFPNSNVVINKRSPDRYRSYSVKTDKDDEEDNTTTSYDDPSVNYIIISNQVMPDESEVNALLNLVGKGQHVFISAFTISESLLDSVHLKPAFYTSLYNTSDSLTVSVKNPETSDFLSFTYPGKALDNYFVKVDSNITNILGRDKYGRPNFVQFNYEGGGSLIIHLAPMAFTNFFLLHKNNKAYYDNAFSYLPMNRAVVRWDEYFRYHTASSSEGSDGKGLFSTLSWINKQQGLKNALPLLLLLMLIIYLFESKRKQRIIPVIVPLKNASVDFVKTVGRLYFQRHDNKNLALKMTVHFQDHVRSRYGIRTALNDPEFEKKLAWKTGYPVNNLQNLLFFMNSLGEMHDVSDAALLEFNRKLEHFYKYV